MTTTEPSITSLTALPAQSHSTDLVARLERENAGLRDALRRVEAEPVDGEPWVIASEALAAVGAPPENLPTLPTPAINGTVLDALVARYTPPEIPPCSVCGAALEISSFGGGRPTQWRCSKVDLGDGKPFDWDHYNQSGWEDRRAGGDSDVVALVNAYRAVLGEVA